MRAVRAALVLALVAGAAGCAQEEASTPSEQWTRDGRPVSLDVMSSATDPCGHDGVRILHLAAPLHWAEEGEPRAARYIRDPDGVLTEPEPEPGSAFNPDATLPADAVPTGYEHDGTTLWLADSDRAAFVYLVTGDRVEAWPRFISHFGCD